MSWLWRLIQNLKKNWSFVSKMARIWWNLTWAVAGLQNLYFHLLLLCKILNVWPKIVQRSYLSWHWRLMQNLKKNRLVVWKMTWGIWQSFIRALESLKIGILMGSFNPKQKKYELKSTGELCVMTMKNDAKFEEELTCHFKIDMSNLMNFDPSTWKSQIFSF